MNQKGSTKREQISRSNSRVIVAFGIAGAIVGFSLVMSYVLVKQMTYRSKVIDARVKAEQRLKENLTNVSALLSAYESFNSAAESVIGTPDNNSKIILDALPSRYDYPALATSLQKIMLISGMSNISISGTDNEASAEQSSTSPVAVEIPFTLSGQGSYASIQKLINNLESSIRPIKIYKIDLNGSEGSLNVSITGVTYYQPKKVLDISLEEVK